MEDNAFKAAFAKAKGDLSWLPQDSIAEIEHNDAQISGGRVIESQKNNVLFTGQFEKSDMDDFVDIWKLYRANTRMIDTIRARLVRRANAMIHNYNGEVCPIEVMLYTSNVVSHCFSNFRLVHEVADAVYNILCIKEKYLQSVRHILTVWKWEQAINICEIAVGKFVAGRENEDAEKLLREIYFNFHYQEVVNYGCFCGLMESKKETFVLDILNMIHDLSGAEEDKPIGNFFKKNFGTYFPAHYNRLDGNTFKDSRPYVQSLVRKMIDPNFNNNLVNEYLQTRSKEGRRHIVDMCLKRLIENNKSGSPYEAVNVLKLAATESISKELFLSLDIKNRPWQRNKDSLLRAIICNYFGTITYLPAVKAFEEISPSNDYYAAARVALFYQGRIGSEEIVKDFLQETRPDRTRTYLDGFYSLQERLPAVRRSTVNYMSRDDLEEDKLSTAITNYFQLIKMNRQLYDPQVGAVMIRWFGYKTLFGQSMPLRISDQMTCLNVIELIINEANRKSYVDFLYYVAEDNKEFSPTVSSLARRILNNLPIGMLGG